MRRHGHGPRHLGLVALGVIAALVTACGTVADVGQPAGWGEVAEVVDGDTIVVKLDGRTETVRLIGIDTPETVHPNVPPECFGAEASARLKELVPPGEPIRLLGDDEPRDQFGRLLAYVVRRDDDLFVNLAMVAEGYAAELHIEPNNRFAGDFADAAAAARKADLGLWGDCGGVDTPAIAPVAKPPPVEVES